MAVTERLDVDKTTPGLNPEEDPRVTWRPSPGGYVARFVVLGLILVLLFGIPIWIPDVLVNVAAKAAVYAIVALSMNMLMGYTGQVSLGHAAFLGFGAFGSAYFISQVGLPWVGGVVAGTIIGGLAAVPLGAVALRVQGLYLALVTIAFGFLASETIFKVRELTGGGAGAQAPRPDWASGNVAYVYLCLGVLFLVWALDWRLTASKAGRAIQALRDDERVAASWGINVTAFKLLAFSLSGAVAGLAGALFASIEQIVSPQDFLFGVSVLFVLMTVVGGLGSRPGVVTGGILFAILPTLFEQAHQAWSWWPFGILWEPLIAALLLILTLIFFPGGIAQQNEHLYRWLSFGKWHADKRVTVAGGAAGAGGGASGRP